MLDAKRKKGIIKLGGGSTNDETILSPRQGEYSKEAYLPFSCLPSLSEKYPGERH